MKTSTVVAMVIGFFGVLPSSAFAANLQTLCSLEIDGAKVQDDVIYESSTVNTIGSAENPKIDLTLDGYHAQVEVGVGGSSYMETKVLIENKNEGFSIEAPAFTLTPRLTIKHNSKKIVLSCGINA